jgi:uncharacterized membrane protein YkoI
MTNKKDLLYRIVLIAMLAISTPLAADDDDDDDRAEREAMRTAVERGDIKSLAEILKLVAPQLPGEIVGIEIERENGIFVYEFRVAGKGGKILEAKVNAATASVISIEEK